MEDDGGLLQAYAQSGSEDAFAQLVGRHVDLVYSTALRAVNGDEALAQDICQSVFIDLARKAAMLSERSLLGGWLYTSTCFAAAKAVRTERRRHTREQEAHAMQRQVSSGGETSNWDQVRPVLESAMLELRETDRDALVLRFFERRSLADTGVKLGLNEHAARMRVERALERLRQRLIRRGITSTAGALAMMLAQHTVTAAPVGLSAAIAASALSAVGTGASTSILNLIAMSKINTIIVGSVLAATAATLISVQHRANTALKAQVQALQAQLVQAPKVEQADFAAVGTEPKQSAGEQSELLRLRGEVTALRRQIGSATDAEARKKAAKLAAEQAEGQALLAKSPEIPMKPAHLWTNAGFATPADAFQTLNWAIANRDTNAFAQAFIWDAQAKARAEALFAAAPESIRRRYETVDGLIFDWVLNNGTPVAADRVLSQIEEGPNEVTLLEQHVYTDGRVRENTIQFERDDGGAWRQVLEPGMMNKLQVVLNEAANAR